MRSISGHLAYPVTKTFVDGLFYPLPTGVFAKEGAKFSSVQHVYVNYESSHDDHRVGQGFRCGK